MISVFVLMALAFQEKTAPVPAETPEHEYVTTAINDNYKLLTAAYHSEADCLKKERRAGACDGYTRNVRVWKEQWELSKAQLDAVDGGMTLYRKTSDKKTSDLTERESTAVKTCQKLALFPLEMPAQAQKQP